MRTQFRLIALLLPLVVTALPAPAVAQWWPAYAESNLRINVKPKEASVYVDGYFAGKVEEFDGQWQRLHVLPGQHEITIWLEGYKSLKQQLYLAPNATRTIAGTLDKLGPGDEPEAEPTPLMPPQGGPPIGENFPPPPQTYPPQNYPPQNAPQPPERRPMPRRPGPPPEQPPIPAPEPPSEPSRYAALVFRVVQEGTTIHVDGQQWEGPSGDERLIIQVTEGHHTIEVDRKGYERYTSDIDAHSGETIPMTVDLRKR